MINNSRSFDEKSSAHKMKHIDFRINIDLTDKKYVFDEPDVYHSDNIAKEAIEDCTQLFHTYKYNCEYKVKWKKWRRRSFFLR